MFEEYSCEIRTKLLPVLCISGKKVTEDKEIDFICTQVLGFDSGDEQNVEDKKVVF